MNQQCRVCGEPAAGFHFGAFTCEGCKSFFGRTYNNVSSLGECKNGGRCVITKKNRTACKACRLRKCLLVGMSKSGSRYGRRSNWFKIHCLLEDRRTSAGGNDSWSGPGTSDDESDTIDVCGPPGVPQGSPTPARTSPALSSPDSHASDNSVEASLCPEGGRRLAYVPHLYPRLSVLPPVALRGTPPAYSLYSYFPRGIDVPLEAASCYSPSFSPLRKSPEVGIAATRTHSPPMATGHLLKRPRECQAPMPLAKRLRLIEEKSTVEPFRLAPPPFHHRSDVALSVSVSVRRDPPVALNAEVDLPMDLSVRSGPPAPPSEDPDILDLSLKSRQEATPKEEPEEDNQEAGCLSPSPPGTPERPLVPPPGVAGSCSPSPLNLALHLQPRAGSVA